ncbi:Uncharacterised protein [Chlamydia trachomatis]|nr:Uncharacterised protein [Chlamydia trachomatis]
MRFVRPDASTASKSAVVSSSRNKTSSAWSTMFSSAWPSVIPTPISSSRSGTSVFKCFKKMSRAPVRSGRSTRMRTSSRPGRRTAGSIMSARFEAPMMMTLSRASTPSISARSWGTIIVSTSDEIPVPRVLNRASISSKKMTTGILPAASERARAKIARMCRSVSPTNLFRSSGPLIDKK